MGGWVGGRKSVSVVVPEEEHAPLTHSSVQNRDNICFMFAVAPLVLTTMAVRRQLGTP